MQCEDGDLIAATDLAPATEATMQSLVAVGAAGVRSMI